MRMNHFSKKLLKISCLAFFGAFLLCKLDAAQAGDKKGTIAVSVQTGQEQVIKDNEQKGQRTEAEVNKDTGTAVSRLQKKAEKLQAELPQMRRGENIVRVKPDVIVNIPDGAFDLILNQDYKQSTFGFNADYDLVHNSMGFGLDFFFKIKPFPIGLALKDNVDFQDVFFGSEYIQRVQSISPYSIFRVYKNTDVKTAIRFEHTVTGALGISPIDQGHNLVGEVGITNDTVDISKPISTGGTRSLDIQRSFANFGSDYNYCQEEIRIRQFAETFAKSFIEYNLIVGYPLTLETRPLSSVYWLGGYKALLGYDYKEFQGFAEIYNRFDYNVAIAGFGHAKFFGMDFSIVTLNFFAEAAKIGGKEIFSGIQDGKYDVGSGIGYTTVLLGILPLKFEVSLVKAFDVDKPAKLYFLISTLNYTFGNGK